MIDHHDALVSAHRSRDPRFDGVFFVGVTTTGIYCRPICTARTPKAANCRFFPSAAAAEHASFRPCLRCRPELAPGNAPVDGARRVASRIAHRIGEGLLDEGNGVEAIAAEFHMSSRQVRRIVQRELGVSPMELVLTRRLLLAKQLLTETDLPVIDIAFSSGFSSLRRFNDAFSRRYRMPPTRLRREAGGLSKPSATPEPLSLRLSYRAPFDWSGILEFLSARALPGVERVQYETYSRTVRLGKNSGWIQIRHSPENNALTLELAPSLAPALPSLLSRLRSLFDLDARPDVIAGHLAKDERLGGRVARNPGLRVPGSFDGFELAVRAILGQQVTVRGATIQAGRLVESLGEPIDTPFAGLTRLSPSYPKVAELDVDDIARLGIFRGRAAAIIGIAREVAEGRLRLEPGVDTGETVTQLMSIRGVGPWTAQYIAMRALRSTDSFPKEDVAIRTRLGGLTPADAETMSQVWRPWRSYATLHLWADDGPE